MQYRAHERRCAVDIAAWHLPISDEEAIQVLLEIGFRILQIDVAALATSFIGHATYRRGARLSEAPAFFDCSGFTKWLYAQRGIWLPRRSAHQFSAGERIPETDFRPGDLIFTNGGVCPPVGPAASRVSHVGIVGLEEDVIHASPKSSQGISRTSLRDWQTHPSWRGGCRILSSGCHILTLEAPSHLDIETSDDVWWTVIETIDWK